MEATNNYIPSTANQVLTNEPHCSLTEELIVFDVRWTAIPEFRISENFLILAVNAYVNQMEGQSLLDATSRNELDARHLAGASPQED